MLKNFTIIVKHENHYIEYKSSYDFIITYFKIVVMRLNKLSEYLFYLNSLDTIKLSKFNKNQVNPMVSMALTFDLEELNITLKALQTIQIPSQFPVRTDKLSCLPTLQIQWRVSQFE